jgi:hypothetical protein
MKYKIPIIIIILLLVGIGAFYYGKQPKPIPQIKPETITEEQKPIVINEILYAKIRNVPINQIYKISIYANPIRFVIIEWKENNLHGGMFTMSFEDFMKVYPILQQVKGIQYA